MIISKNYIACVLLFNSTILKGLATCTFFKEENKVVCRTTPTFVARKQGFFAQAQNVAKLKHVPAIKNQG